MATPNQPSSTRAALKNTFGSLRHRPPSAVPTGTVASRISYLQSLASGTSRHAPSALKTNSSVRSKRPEPAKQEIDVDEDPGRFGRRTSAKFGYPAQRNDDSYEDQPEEKGHRIMGWQIKRAKNDDDNKSLSSVSSKKGFRAKVKDVFTHGDRQDPSSPEIIHVNARTVPISINNRAKQNSEHAQISIAPTVLTVVPPRRPTPDPTEQPPVLAKVASRDFAEEALISGNKVHKWLAGARSGSEDSVGQSVATTSTGRVRSVQQMYSSYGIPEPSELFSKALPQSRAVGGEPRRCHVCKWINVGVERCSCCGHRLCADCEIEAAVPTVRRPEPETATLLLDDTEGEEGSTYSRYSISEVAHKTSIEFKQGTFDKSTIAGGKRSSRQSPMSLQKAPPKVGIFEERFDLPQRDPSIAVAYAYTSGDGASPPHPVKAEPPTQKEPLDALYQPLREQRESLTKSSPIPPEVIIAYSRTLSPPRIFAPEVKQAKKKSVVKDSPFLRADQDAVKKPSHKLKRVTHKGAPQVHPAPSTPPKHEPLPVAAPLATPDRSSQIQVETVAKEDEASSIKCDSPGCRATHTGHRPYRHSISCSRRKGAVETVPSTPNSPKDAISKLRAASPSSPLMPKPLSPVKRKTDEMKTLEATASHPAVAAVFSGKLAKENAQEKVKKLSAESAIAHGQASPYTKAVVSVLATKTELISPLGSDGHEDEPPVVPKKTHPSAPSNANSHKKRLRSQKSSSESDYATITSTGQITTIYETSIIEHPLYLKRKRNTQQRPAHRRGKHAPFSFSSDTPRPSRSSAERSHEELLRRKHQALCQHPITAFGVCPATPHTHRIQHSTEYIDCQGQPETQVSHERALRSSINGHIMTGQDASAPSLGSQNHRDINHNNRLRKQYHPAERHSPQEQQWKRGDDQSFMEQSQHDLTHGSIDHGTFTSNLRQGENHTHTNISEAASACMPVLVESQRTGPETHVAMSGRQPARAEGEDDSKAQVYGGQNRLKQLGNSVVNRGNSAISKGWDVHKRIVKPRARLEARKQRAKYGDMDVRLAGQEGEHNPRFDASPNDRHTSSESAHGEHNNERLHSVNVSDTSNEPEPSTRVSYLQRRQMRPAQGRRGESPYRKDGVMHSRNMEADDDYRREGTGFEDLYTQPSIGTEYRHQSHPAQGRRRDSGMPPQLERSGQSFAGHETFSHRNTGLYSDSSSDSFYYDDRTRGLSREIVFESDVHGQGAMVLPVALEDEGRYTSGSDIEREQSRKVNRAGLRMSKSVRHIVGAAGPVLPAVMPIAMEDTTVAANPSEGEVEDESEQEHTVNRAGLRMSNSVRHIVGADGPMSFSHAHAQQNSPPSSRYHSHSSGDYNGSQILPAEAVRPEISTKPRAQREYWSRSRRSDAPSLSSVRDEHSAYQEHAAFHTSAGQFSSQRGESGHHVPTPSREQPYCYASASGILKADEKASRTQSFSASRMLLFEKLQNALPDEHLIVMQDYHQGLTSSTPSNALLPLQVDHADEKDTNSNASSQKQPGATNDEAFNKAKRRMNDSPRVGASKKRKFSEDKEDESQDPAANLVVATFFATARGKALKAVDGVGATQSNAQSVQSLRQKFSYPTPEKSRPTAVPNPFRQRKGDTIKAFTQSVLPAFKLPQAPEPAKEKEVDAAENPVKPGPPETYSTDGARSRVHTISAQQAPRMSAMPEANATGNDAATETPVVPASKSKEKTAEERKESEVSRRARLLRQLGPPFNDTQEPEMNMSPANLGDAFSRHDRNPAKKKYTPAAQPKALEPVLPVAAPPKTLQDNVLSRQTAKYTLCNTVVFMGSMEAHVEKCSLEQVEEMMIKEEVAKQRAVRERSSYLRGNRPEDNIVINDAPSTAARLKSLKAGLAQWKSAGKTEPVGTANGDTNKGEKPRLTTAAVASIADGDIMTKDSSNTASARRGTVSMLAQKFQQPAAQRSPTKPTTAKTPAAKKAAASAPLAKELSVMGTDGAFSATPVIVLAEKLPLEFTKFLAEIFELEVEELGEITIEVGGKGKRKRLSCEVWKE